MIFVKLPLFSFAFLHYPLPLQKTVEKWQKS
jgi:hypothetical protein